MFDNFKILRNEELLPGLIVKNGWYGQWRGQSYGNHSNTILSDEDWRSQTNEVYKVLNKKDDR